MIDAYDVVGASVAIATSIAFPHFDSLRSLMNDLLENEQIDLPSSGSITLAEAHGASSTPFRMLTRVVRVTGISTGISTRGSA